MKNGKNGKLGKKPEPMTAKERDESACRIARQMIEARACTARSRVVYAEATGATPDHPLRS